MVVREAAATMAVMHSQYAFAIDFSRFTVLYCTVQYIMEPSDDNSIEPAMQGGVKE
jgi:hypothetical protein